MKSYKTTIFAIITAAFGFILFAPEYFQSVPWLIDLAKFGAAGGLVAFGLSAKDNNVTGGSKKQQ